MKIIYTENPLASIIELDEKDKENLLNKIKAEQYEENAWLAEFYKDEGKEQEAEKYLKKNLDLESFNSQCLHIYNYCLGETNGTHVGDCTCMACSCAKCYLENLLEINTTKGCSKYMGHYIFTYFNKNKKIDDVIEALENYQVNMSPEDEKRWEKAGGYKHHVPRWTEDAKKTAKWLREYKQNYLNKER